MFVIKKKVMSPSKVFTVRKWSGGKVMFLYLSVIHFVHREEGVSASGSMGCLPLVRSFLHLGSGGGGGWCTPPRQTLPCGCLPLGPGAVHLRADTHQRQILPRADTPQADPPPQQETATKACGTHPTGMNSCFFGGRGETFNFLKLRDANINDSFANFSSSLATVVSGHPFPSPVPISLIYVVRETQAWTVG